MQPSPDSNPAKPALPRHPMARILALIFAMIAVGFGLTLYVFYPGVMTYDARYVYEDIAKGILGDWQSPVMTVLWSAIDPLAPGSASMFLLTATLYWLAFGLLACTLARTSPWHAAVLILFATLPPAFAYVGVIWRDVLFAVAWLLASTLTFAAAQWHVRLRVPGMVAALALLAFGVLLRPNALLAAPLLGAYVLFPARFVLQRVLLLYAPIAVALFGLQQFVYYGVLHATPQHLLQTFMVFDLGGISHFSKENQFPGNWSEQERAIITTGCYQPTEWDIYWIHEPCLFVMKRLEDEKLFGTPALVQAWLRAIAGHPAAYLEHRTAFMWNFIAKPNLTIWTTDVFDPSKSALAGRTGFAVLRAVDAALKPTPLSRAGTWLLACLAICAIAWRRRDTLLGAFAIATCAAAAAYVLTFFAVGVASDFRYAYGAVLAAIAGGVTIAVPARTGTVSA